jgi:hypothetical protein
MTVPEGFDKFKSRRDVSTSEQTDASRQCNGEGHTALDAENEMP